ncbi:delta-like protein 1 [Patella vulgata]|uniref:delta-like protein 1 n=1 Tax=Patella vulgata TaxID=6465 RepID=UPI0024A7F46C|nr:delta-like protein 1 [Patella vulgata]
MSFHSYFGLTVIFMLAVFQSAVGSGILEIKLLKFYGDGDGSNGHCCDGKFFICPTKCDPKFTICVDNAYGSDSMNDCQFGKYTTGDTIDTDHIVFGDYIGGMRNYFPFKFTQWTGVVKVKVDIVDVDDVNSHDHIDTIRRHINRAPTRPPRYTAELIKQRTSLEIDARVSCDAHYYRHDCFIYCKPSDDAINGYYTCNQDTGAKICKQGWTGSSCNVDIDECEESICQNNGTCTNTNGSYSCSCLQGYKG